MNNAVDVFFLSDNTGSMGGLISNVQSSANAILDALTSDDRFNKVNIQFGVGAYNGDPTEGYETPLSAYMLQQTITDSKSLVVDAINDWEASGGGDYPEGNFYAIQQAVTDGAATPRNSLYASNQVTNWRTSAKKVVIVFGDAQSWQNSVNEAELKQVLKDNNTTVLFIDTSTLDSGLSTMVSDNTTIYNNRQMEEATQEIADFTNGTYTKLLDVTKVKDAVLDAVYDAVADNSWSGGMLAKIDSSNWRKRTPSSVTATTADSDVFEFILKYPNLNDSTFTIDTTTAAKVSGTEYYSTSITDANDIFGKNMSSAIAHFNLEKDFFRFLFQNGSNSYLDGYYGERATSSDIPSSGGVSYYNMRSSIISPYENKMYSTNDDKMYINWNTGKVLSIGQNLDISGKTGTSIFIGDLSSENMQIDGRYIYKSSRTRTSESSVIPRFITDTQRGNTSLQLFGDSSINGLGGTYGVSFF